MSYAAISLGLFIFIMAYFTWNAPLQGPSGPTPPPQQNIATNEYCQLAGEDAPTFQGPADNVKKQGDDDIDPSQGRIIEEPKHCGQQRHQIGQMTTYRLLRRNVPMTLNDVKEKKYLWDASSCHFSTTESMDVEVEGVDTSKFKVFYPQISGEISLDRMMYSRSRDVDSSYLYFIDYGMVFLLHLNPDGTFVELRGGTHEGDQEAFYLADIYHDVGSNRPEPPPEAFACDTTKGSQIASGKAGNRIILPTPGENVTPDQLQLQYFVFTTQQQSTGSGPVVNGWGVHCKPAVYLYPPDKRLVNVKVFPKGELSYTDPPYNPSKGWTVWASPNGVLSSTNNLKPATYPYLYYESKLLDSEIKKPEKGWVVRPDEMANLLNRVLPQLGLNKKEQKDFMDYWLNKLPDSPYYFVGLVEKQQRDYLEALQVIPNPDTSIRFSLFFEMLDQPISVQEPVINTPVRNGFTLVDWGGMIKLHPNTPFTCSQ